LFAVVVQRPLARPAVVSGPGGVAALKEEVASPVVANDKDDVALQLVAFGRQFAEINAAGPILGDDQAGGRFPVALAQPFSADCWVRLASALERANPEQVAAALALVVTEPVEIQDKGRRRIGTDHDIQGVAGPEAGVRAVAFDPGTAVPGL